MLYWSQGPGELQAGAHCQPRVAGPGEGRGGRGWGGRLQEARLQEARVKRKGSPKADVEMAAGIKGQCEERYELGIKQTPRLKKERLVYHVRRVLGDRPEEDQELMAGLLMMLTADSEKAVGTALGHNEFMKGKMGEGGRESEQTPLRKLVKGFHAKKELFFSSD